MLHKTHTDYLNSSLFFDYLQYPLAYEIFYTLREYTMIFGDDEDYLINSFDICELDEDWSEDPFIEDEFLLLGFSNQVTNPDEAAIFGKLEMHPDCEDYEELTLFEQMLDDDFIPEEEQLLPESKSWFFFDLINFVSYWNQVSKALSKGANFPILFTNIYKIAIDREFDEFTNLNKKQWHYFSERQSVYSSDNDPYSKFKPYPKDILEKKFWSNYVPTIEKDNFSNYLIAQRTSHITTEGLETKKDLKGEYYNTASNYYISYFIHNYNRVFSKDYNISIFTTNFVNVHSQKLEKLKHSNLYYLTYEENIVDFNDFNTPYQIFFIYELMSTTALVASSYYMMEEYNRNNEGTSIARDLWPFIMSKKDIAIQSEYNDTEDLNQFRYSGHYSFMNQNNQYYGYSGKFDLTFEKINFSEFKILKKKEIKKNKMKYNLNLKDLLRLF
jgi:hypothetical protein